MVGGAHNVEPPLDESLSHLIERVETINLEGDVLHPGRCIRVSAHRLACR
jgi:hypothetical protein